MTIHEKYITRCIQLAENGLGRTYPNPIVGSVIVYNDKIIGEGWHQKAGEAHAEVNAVASVKDRSLLSKSTIYVSLEPCSHYGKTPPCSNLIIDSGIKKVVIGTVDPFSEVAGMGIKKLLDDQEYQTLSNQYTSHTQASESALRHPFLPDRESEYENSQESIIGEVLKDLPKHEQEYSFHLSISDDQDDEQVYGKNRRKQKNPGRRKR